MRRSSATSRWNVFFATGSGMLLSLVALAAVCFLVPQTAQAAIVFNGDYDPGNSDDWDSNTDGYVGKTSDGTVTVDSGSELESSNGYLGHDSGITGTATITGSDSKWTAHNEQLYIGYNGNGLMSILSGGNVSLVDAGWGNNINIGYSSTGAGTVTVNDGSLFSNRGIKIGVEGSGTLYVQNGGNVTSNSSMYLGAESSGTGMVTVNNAYLESGGDLHIGYNGTGSLAVQTGGTVTSGQANVGYNSGSSGTLTVDNGLFTDSGSSLNIAYNEGATGLVEALNGGTISRSSITVGSGGMGTMNVTGSYVSSGSGLRIGADDTATGAVDFNNSVVSIDSDLTVGNSGTGTLDINHGSSVTVGGKLYVARESGSAGTISFGAGGGTITAGTLMAAPSQFAGTGTLVAHGIISDSNLTFNSPGDLTQNLSGFGDVTATLDLTSDQGVLGVGNQSSASLSIDGTTVTSSEGMLGYRSGSTGTAAVNGTNSSWTMGGQLTVGYEGDATLEITNGATVTSSSESSWSSDYIGYQDSSNSAVTVDGDGSTWNSGQLFVGYMGTGALSILNDAVVNSTRGCIGDNGTSQTGVVTVDGSTWTIHDPSEWNDAELTIGGSGAWQSGAGTLSITNNSHVSVEGKTSIAENSSAVGRIDFGATNGGTLSTGSFYASASQVTGAGTIETHGLVCDATLLFDSGHTATQSMSFGSATLNLALTSDYDLGVGYKTSGSMTIDGVAITSNKGFVAYSGGSSGTATITGAGGSWTVNNDFNVGKGGTGTVNVTGGANLSTNGWGNYLGSDSGSSGTVKVNGNATWDCNGDLYVGGGNWSDNAPGMVEISTGGTVNCNSTTYLGYYGTGSEGTVTVNGAGSTLNATGGDLWIGHWTPGAMSVLNGGKVASGTSYIGGEGTWTDDKTSTVTVSGAGSTWECDGDLRLGAEWGNGYGVLNIGAGGAVTCNETMVVGPYYEDITSVVNFSGGTLTTRTILALQEQVTGNGTINTRGIISDRNFTFNSEASLNQTFTWGSTSVNLDVSDPENNPGDLGVGLYESRSLTISNGVTVYSNNGYLGYSDQGDYGGNGTATITGATWVCQDTLIIGRKGKGTVNIENGGTVITNQVAGADDGDNCEMTLIFNGGTLKAHDDPREDWVKKNGDGNIYIKAGGATFDTDGHDVGVEICLETHSTSTGGGVTKIGEGELKFSDDNSNYTYTGLTTVVEGTLKLEDHSDDFSQSFYPVLSLGGADIQGGQIIFHDEEENVTSTVAGLLNAGYTGGTAPWTTGKFLSTTADSQHGLGWFEDGDEVTVMYTLYGDSNCDGSVNGTDLNAVLSYYNQSSQIWNHGDFNYDGSVNGTDLNTVLSNYNQSLSASTAAVPEPSTLLLTVAGLASLLAYVMRKRK